MVALDTECFPRHVLLHVFWSPKILAKITLVLSKLSSLF